MVTALVAALVLAVGALAPAAAPDAAAAGDRLWRSGTDPAPSFAAVRSGAPSSRMRLLDRHGAELDDVRVDATLRRLEWTPLAEISPALQAALIAGEDKRFLAHKGVDWPGLVVAAWDSVWRVTDGRRIRGGSTLTMQLAALLDPELKPGAAEPRTIGQKWDQIAAARTLEDAWSKAEILEAYLNLVTYRGELVGIRAAASRLFGKAPSGLDAREAAILVALLRSPGAQPAIVAQRACAVAAAAASGAPCEAIRARAAVALAGGYRAIPRAGAAPHLAAKLARSTDSSLVTTLDGDLQRFAVRTLHDHLADLAARNVEDGAIVVLDNATGDILAYVGSSGELSRAPEVDGAAAPRQAGSTLKPFLYARAIDDRMLTAASLVDDSPLAIATARGVYVPQNYDRDFHGTVSVRTALAGSLNVPAVRTAELVGVARLYDDLRDLGLDTLTEDAEHYGAALALGGADVTLAALTNAYRALANGGVFGPTRVRVDAPTGAATRRVFRPAAAFIVADILADRGARAGTFGLDNPLATRVWSAVKTGTSKDMRDNWCVGFTARYTVGVWVGNFSGAPMHDVSGITGAAPIFRDIVHYLHRDEGSTPPRAPAGVVAQEVRFDPPVEPSRREWFLRGTAMGRVRAVTNDAEAALTPRIRYPAPDTLVALDPDIAPGHERIVLVAAPGAADLRWRVDGRLLEAPGARVAWIPTGGRHRVTLEDGAGGELSSVEFEVRGTRVLREAPAPATAPAP
ncbi:MAG: penicillin-binding protein 1C [Burkholderiales bacterium]|nr:penicillin-binding protein 1C [Burkholderiales bacterium]